ncbi:chloride channel protein [Periweissella beninensis]|uniref:chloride channel protein n=1 Tax=Periweissella beninensis TaxID=504936 RepID=UPI0021A36F21|nr:chloride channel protein [Periweissella beninensis]MCT4396946.1 chloride channel protein [Periweissella beninensis]
MNKKFFTSENFTLVISTLILGLLVGLSSVMLSMFLELIEHLFLNFNETVLNPSPISTQPFRRLISVILGGTISGLIWYFLRKHSQGPIAINAALKGKQMPFWPMLIHTFTQIFYVGTGGSVGRELAPREAGAMLASQWDKLLEKTNLTTLSPTNKQLLIASAAGAGFAGVYIAPITGMFFAVEILLKDVSVKNISVSLGMSTIAMLVGATYKGFTPYYAIPTNKFSLTILPIILIIAPLCGFLGGLFRKSFKWAEKKQTHNLNIVWQLPLVSLITGIISMRLPQIMGNGRALAQLAISASSRTMLTLLLIGAILKALVTVFTIKAGAAGGTLTPSISIGAVVGGLITAVSTNSLPQGALIGAVSLLAASQQAPLMALFMIFEVVHLNYSALLPLGLAVSLAIGTSQIVLNYHK